MSKFRILTFMVAICICSGTFAQVKIPDSLKNVLSKSKEDTAKVNTLIALSKALVGSSPDEALSYAIKARDLAVTLKFVKGEAYALKYIGIYYYNNSKNVETLDNWLKSLDLFKSINYKLGISNMLSNIGALYDKKADDAKALEYTLQSLQLSEELGDKLRIATALLNIGNTYLRKKATRSKALQYLLKAIPISEELKDQDLIVTLNSNLGDAYYALGKTDSALFYFKKGLEASHNSEEVTTIYILNYIGKGYAKKGNYDLAINYQKQSVALAKKLKAGTDIGKSLLGLGDTYFAKGDITASLESYKEAETFLKDADAIDNLKDTYTGLTKTYEKLNDYQKAYHYQSLLSNVKDTIYNIETDKKLSSLQFDFDMTKKQSQINLLTKDTALKELDLQKQKNTKNVFAIGFGVILLFAFVIVRNNRQKQKTNKELEQTLVNLKSTQSQLVHAEKMASLGELTAGIAHEIQNPLNFVNNFSDVNRELLEEMKEEMDKGNLEDAKAIANDVMENEVKINHHGKRADSIVKGMLQHSRTGSGVKEPADINALADEYLRLGYHGLRAKDNSFNATMVTDYDATIGMIQVIPQDIARVLLNLITNAFYAVGEKKKELIPGYEPTVSVSTKRKNDKVEIRVRDNGNGIPQKVMDKIFQPFFTTKPTGEGTGLGLSMSYDIVTKGHGGKITATTAEGEYAEFCLTLPV
jgi:two-component system NtrC family sensor kinase